MENEILESEMRARLTQLAQTAEKKQTRQRAEAVLRLDAGEAPAAVAEALGVSLATIYNWRKSWRERGLASMLPKEELAALPGADPSLALPTVGNAPARPLSAVPAFVRPEAHCPYLGLDTDAETTLTFPSEQHFCYRAKAPVAPTFGHQADFCLSANFERCPAFISGTPDEIPQAVLLSETPSSNVVRWLAIFLLGGISLVVLFGLLLQFVFPRGATLTLWRDTPEVQTTSTSVVAVLQMTYAYETEQAALVTPLAEDTYLLATPTATVIAAAAVSPTPTPRTTLAPTQTPSATGTRTPLPTATHTPSPTHTPRYTPGPAVNTPFGPDNRYMVHIIAQGESYASLAEDYSTTVDVLDWVNPRREGKLLWAGSPIIILPGQTSTVGLPRLLPLYLEEPVLLADLAEQYGVESAVLRGYNLLGTDPVIPAGRWVLLPAP